MSSFDQGKQVSDVLKWEPNPMYCRERVKLAASQAVDIGTVLGPNSGGAFGIYDPTGETPAFGHATVVALQKVTSASSGDFYCTVLARNALVAAESLIIGTGHEADAIADLAAAGIVARRQV